MTKSTSAGSDAKSREVAPFLKNLRKMLDQESDEILRWTPNGRAFEIHDMERMMDYVLPKYFKHRKYTSFQRQLNYFNFKKWTKSKAAVCTFSNDCFLRDEPDLSWRITRKKSVSSTPSAAAKSAASRKAASAVTAATTSTASGSAPAAAAPATWKTQQDMAIVVPHPKAEPHHEAFPSPTDMDMMLHESETEVQRYYNPFAMHAHGEDSLDWIDNFLPSLEVPSKIEDPYYYHSSSMAIPSMLRTSAPYPPASYHSLPPPSSFGCVSAVL